MGNNTISQLVDNARKAQTIASGFSQDIIDEMVTAIAWEVIKPDNNAMLSEMAVKTTGLGKVVSKITKNYRKTFGLLRDLQNAKTVGMISNQPEKGIVEIAKPVGVIAAVIPSTNPVATPLNKTINALKCGNAIILAPSPKGEKVCSELLKFIHIALKRVGAPIDLVQKLPAPISKEMTNELMEKVDLVVATGSQNNILRAVRTGTPTLGVGVGNAPSIIDESANITDAVEKIIASKTFDNATSCSSENSLIIIDKVYQDTIACLQQHNAVLLSSDEKEKLQKLMWDENKVINRNIVGQSAKTIANLASLDDNKYINAEVLLVEEQKAGEDFLFSHEKISPVLTVYKATNFDDAIGIANAILAYQGKGHSCGIHSNNQSHINRLAEQLPV